MGHIEKYELFGTIFDAYATYTGHYLKLSLALFTDIWGNPFDGGFTDSAQICPSILETRAQISEIAARFRADKEKQMEVKNWLSSTTEKYYNQKGPYLKFAVYAGRREWIDRNVYTHNVWSQLRSNTPNIPRSEPEDTRFEEQWIFTYDVLVEELLREETPRQRNTLNTDYTE